VSDWHEQAACRHSTTPFFAPDTDQHQNSTYDYSRAVAICRSCPVQFDCLNFALDNRETDGVWGGTTPNERRRMLGLRPKRVEEPLTPHGTYGAIKRHRLNDEKVCGVCKEFRAREWQRYRARRESA
jgi:WhiB family transcriptional regulator, redox-sensing transcriptional regulator